MRIKFTQTGDFNKTKSLLNGLLDRDYPRVLDKYGKAGVDALCMATPKDTGNTANSWGYKIEKNANGYGIVWMNTNTSNGISVALLIQYGHGTRNGAYVEGIDYINPAIQPIFEKMANEVWGEIK